MMDHIFDVTLSIYGAVSQVIRAKLQTAQGHINTVRGRQ